jgi:hypothetical protein
MGRRWSLAVAAWLAAAVLTTVAGIAAISSLGAGLLGGADRPLSPVQVASQLAAEPAASAVPSKPPSSAASSVAATPPPGSADSSATTTPPATRTKVLVTTGGSIVTSCTGGLARLHSWSPAQGYRADHAEPGPAAEASIRFEGDRDEVRATVTCADDQPQLSVRADDNHSGS